MRHMEGRKRLADESTFALGPTGTVMRRQVGFPTPREGYMFSEENPPKSFTYRREETADALLSKNQNKRSIELSPSNSP